MLFYGQRQHFLNLKSGSESDDEVFANFGTINFDEIAPNLVNKEYKTSLERRLILGLISRDYNLHEIEDKEDKVVLGPDDQTPQGNFTSQIPLESFAMEESINAIMEEE